MNGSFLHPELILSRIIKVTQGYSLVSEQPPPEFFSFDVH